MTKYLLDILPSSGFQNSLSPPTPVAEPCQPFLLVPLPLVTLINTKAQSSAFLSGLHTLPA